MHITQAQQRHLIGFAGLCVDGIPEEQQQVDLIAGDAGCDLLIAALDPCQKALYLQARGLTDQFSGGACGYQLVLA